MADGRGRSSLKVLDLGNLYQEPHRRFNLLTRDWMLVSPHRTQRPWAGQVEAATAPPTLQYYPTCYLCPGNERAGGAHNSDYQSTFVFTNDFAALRPGVQHQSHDDSGRGLQLAESEAGTCRVVCFSPRHDLTLARMTVPADQCSQRVGGTVRRDSLYTLHQLCADFRESGRNHGL